MSFCRDKYRLELHWANVNKTGNMVCVLKGAYFFGPALKIAEKINGGDSITIDLTPQYSKIITSYYFVTLSWKEVKYESDKVYLLGATLIGDYVNEVSNLSKCDFIMIDTQDHEEKVHKFHLVYRGMVVTKEGESKT